MLKYSCSAWWYLDSHCTLNTVDSVGGGSDVLVGMLNVSSMLVSKQLCPVTKGVCPFKSIATYGSITVSVVVTVGILDSEIVKMFALLILLLSP